MKANHMREELQHALPFYTLVDDCIEGEYAIKRGGEQYLKRAVGIPDSIYDSYKFRAEFLPAAEKTLNSFVALLTRRTASFDASEKMKSYIKQNGMDTSGLSLFSYTKASLQEIFKSGRVGFFVDYHNIDNNIESLADYEKSRNRAVACIYPSKSIINWKYKNGKLVLVVLKEFVKEESDDFFVDNTVEQNRVLRIDERGVCIQEIYRKDKNKRWELFDVKNMIVNNKMLTSIPFIIQNYDGSNPDTVPVPPLYDICSINIKHYGNSADYQSALHVLGSPTPILKKNKAMATYDEDGENDDDEVFTIGHGFTNVIDISESFEIVEMSGNGLQRLEYSMLQCVENMAKAGARFLQSEKNVGESFETQYLRRSGEYSMLASVAQAVSHCVTRVLEMIQVWEFNSSETIELEIHSNFNNQPDSAEMINILVNLYLNDALPYSDLYDRLQANSLVNKANTAEEAIEKIKIENGM